MNNKGTVEGTIKVFFTRERPTKSGGYGYGFIRREGGSDVYAHARQLADIIIQHGEDGLKGLKVVFEIRDGKKGPEAANILTAEEVASARWEVVRDGEFACQTVGSYGDSRTIAKIGFLDDPEEWPQDLPDHIRYALEEKRREYFEMWEGEAERITAARRPMDWTNWYTQSDWTSSDHDPEFPGCSCCGKSDFAEYAIGEDGTTRCQECWEAERHELCEEIRKWHIFRFPSPTVARDLEKDDTVAHFIGREDLREDERKAIVYLGWSRPDDETGFPQDMKEFGRMWAKLPKRRGPRKAVRR